MEAGIQQLVTAAPAVSALIGSRLYPLLLPDAPVYPAATYQVISCVEEQTLDGPTGIFTARVQVDAWSPSYSETKATAAAIRGVLDGFDGTLADGTRVANMWLCDSPADAFTPEARLYRTQQDFKLIYSLAG